MTGGGGYQRPPPPAGMGLTLLQNNKEKINSSFLHLFAEIPMNLESLKKQRFKGTVYLFG